MPTPTTQSTQSKAVKSSPRERLLQAASELFYAEGVQSVGIDRVIERAGVAKASLYSTFGSKEQLVCAYLDARHAQMLGRLRAAVDAVEDPVERILAVFDAQAQLFRAPDYRGCAFTAAAAEVPAGGRVDEAAESYRRDIRALFTELAAAADAPNPAFLASQLQLVYDGGGLAAKMDQNPDIATPARAAASALLATALAL
ncbi:MAG TPA: TetR/AcrR family transcriptional regulator [Solirubrobacteraceae bacterium]|jgi:AcrR family transcriptional regulator|nr:TetR/AcrR family transcriptional regulator [Solirubrobacteraceae bacterium]